MGWRWLAGTVLGVAVAACQALPLAPARVPAGAARPATKSVDPTPSARPTPAASPALLVAPAATARTLAGVIQVDAGYAVAHAGARIVSDNGSGAVTLGSTAGLATTGGANAIAPDGADAAGLASITLANDAGNLVTDHGSGVISNNGGSAISNHGAGVVSNNGAAFGLLAVASPAPPALGTLLPAAGWGVRLVDMATGTSIPLGRDAAGKPVYSVLTDAAGGFKVYPDGTAGGAVRLQAVPIGSSDSRLAVAALTTKLPTSLDADDDATRVTVAVRLALASGLEFLFGRTPEGIAARNASIPMPPALRDALTANETRVIEAGQKAGVAAMSSSARRALALRATDAGLAVANLDDIQLSQHGLDVSYEGPDGPALPALVELVRRRREKVAATMTALTAAGTDPIAYFAAKPYIHQASARDAVPYAILRPADFNDFVTAAVYANPTLGLTDKTNLLHAIDADADVALGAEQTARFEAAESAVFTTLLIEALGPGDGSALARVLAAISGT